LFRCCPSAEIPLVAVTLKAEIEIANLAGRTTMPADDFFIGPMLTAAVPGDCVCAVRFPIWRHPQVGSGFHEVSARKSDFALVAAAAQLALDAEGRCVDAALGLSGIGDRAIALDVSPLIGERPTAALISDLVRSATQNIETIADLHATASYRRRVAVTMGTRALEVAWAEAREANRTLQ
jgi:CO/xanthine dehydrogenase FAD-binding subunit